MNDGVRPYDSLRNMSWRDGRELVSGKDAGLGGNIDHGDPFTHAPTVWDYLVHRFAVRSVLDVGCGQGHAAAYFHRVHGCAVIAIDGLARNIERAVYPIIVHDLRHGPVLTRVDLVHCVETVEHIEAQFVDHVISTLCCGSAIVMTHAEPGQPGYHHVNCQPSDYWIGLLQQRGYSLSVEDTARIRARAEYDRANWIAKTGMVFIRD